MLDKYNTPSGLETCLQHNDARTMSPRRGWGVGSNKSHRWGLGRGF